MHLTSYNTFHFSMVLVNITIYMDYSWTPDGHLRLILLYIYTFYSCYNTDYIADIGECISDRALDSDLHQTPNREVLGSIPTGGTMLCP